VGLANALLLASFMAAGAAGTESCVEPEQYGGPIAVDPSGIEARLRSACGIRGPSAVCDVLVESDADADAGSR
jgi:hypothetical protein